MPDPVSSSNGDAASTSESLLDRARTNDQDAWVRLLEFCKPAVRSMCQRWALQPADVEDVSQSVLTAIVAALPRFDRKQPGAFRAWLRKITLNKLRDWYRDRQKNPRGEGGSSALEALAQVPEPDSALDQSVPPEMSLLVRSALELVRLRVEDSTWRAYEETEINQRDAEAVAQELGISRNAVYVARTRVRQYLNEEFGDLLVE
jgi:RNA polymerase sigma-70 factor (ECF subfamily)